MNHVTNVSGGVVYVCCGDGVGVVVVCRGVGVGGDPCASPLVGPIQTVRVRKSAVWCFKTNELFEPRGATCVHLSVRDLRDRKSCPRVFAVNAKQVRANDRCGAKNDKVWLSPAMFVVKQKMSARLRRLCIAHCQGFFLRSGQGKLLLSCLLNQRSRYGKVGCGKSRLGRGTTFHFSPNKGNKSSNVFSKMLHCAYTDKMV